MKHAKETMKNKNIILTGFMGTGKTTVGRLIAKTTGYRFVDTDDMIVKKAGKPVSQIFEIDGETAFRRMEADLAVELSKAHGLVIATGGGMLLNDGNARMLGMSGQIFCLVADPDAIIHRVVNDGGAPRPLLNVPDPKKKVAELLAQRESTYGQFIQIETTKRSPKMICREIIDFIGNSQ